MCERGECPADRTGWKLPQSPSGLSDRVRPQRPETPPGGSLHQLQPMQSALSAGNRYSERTTANRSFRRTTETRDIINQTAVPISDGCFLSQNTVPISDGCFYLQKHRPDFGRLFFISKNTVPISDGCFLSPKTPSRFRTAVSMSKNTVLILGNYIPPFKSNFL